MPLRVSPLCRCFLIFVAALAGAGCRGSEERAPVPTAIAELRSIERIVVATGTVEPEGEVEVRPRIAGIIEKILVEPGDAVSEGQVLVEIERELIEARVAEAHARVQASEVQLRYAKISMQRASKLQLQGASSDSAHDEARSLHETSIALLLQSRAGLETLAVQLRHASVRAPSDGHVLDVPVEVGAAVSPVTAVTGGTVLLSLAATDRLHLDGSVDENEIAKVALDQPARIRTEAFGERVFEGRVRKIAPVGQRIQNVTYFEVEIEITDEDRHVLKPRMSGDADIVTETIPEALVVPETALRYEGQQIYVDVWKEEPNPDDPDTVPERHDVEIGVVDGDLVEILSGLQPGDRVSLQ